MCDWVFANGYCLLAPITRCSYIVSRGSVHRPIAPAFCVHASLPNDCHAKKKTKRQKGQPSRAKGPAQKTPKKAPSPPLGEKKKKTFSYTTTKEREKSSLVVAIFFSLRRNFFLWDCADHFLLFGGGRLAPLFFLDAVGSCACITPRHWRAREELIDTGRNL
nr:hypothetical protein [Pandoravirus aubagnensis]